MLGISPEILPKSYARNEIRIADGNFIVPTHVRKEIQILRSLKADGFPSQ
jgi:hypothetical protein